MKSRPKSKPIQPHRSSRKAKITKTPSARKSTVSIPLSANQSICPERTTNNTEIKAFQDDQIWSQEQVKP